MVKSTPKWSEEKIAEGFKRFVIENGRLPTVLEIDITSYLPSSKLIQRRFGGVQKLRKSLGYELTSFNKGSVRTETALRINKLGRSYELNLQKFLENIYGKEFVHNEKALNNSIEINSRNTINLDFYVFSLDGSFGVDIFHAKDRHSLVGSIIHKLKIYDQLKEDIYLVLYSDKVTQKELDLIISRKHNLLKMNIKVFTYNSFMNYISTSKRPYPKLSEMYESWSKKV